MTAISEQTMESLAAGALSEQEVGDIVALGSEAAVLVIPERSRQLAEQRAETAAESHQTPATPSGMQPPLSKAVAKIPQAAGGGQTRTFWFAAQNTLADRSARDNVCLASRQAGRSFAANDRHIQEKHARATLDQSSATPPKRSIPIPGSTMGSFRQQGGQASNSPSGNYPQEQLRQPERSRCRQSSRLDGRFPYAETARSRPDPRHRRRTDQLPYHRPIAVISRRENHFTRLNGY